MANAFALAAAAIATAPAPAPASDDAAALERAARELCVCCTRGEAAEYTAVQLLPTGLCLHSCEYEGGGAGGGGAGGGVAWHFVAPLPKWVAPFV